MAEKKEKEMSEYQKAEIAKTEAAREVVKKHYRQPLAIAQFLLDDHPMQIMRRVIEAGEAHFDATGITPIVKQENADLYSLDYYFFVNQIAIFAHDVYKGKNEELAEAFKRVIHADFGAYSYYKNKALLINIFDNMEILFASMNKKFIYSLQRYRQVHSDKAFVLSVVTIDGKFVSKLDGAIKEKFDKIVNPINYKLEARGQKAWQGRLVDGKTENFHAFM